MTNLAPIFEGAKFSELVSILYQRMGIILFALQIYDKKGGSIPTLFLNPANYVIPSQKIYRIEGFVIAKNKAESDLSFMDVTNEDSGKIASQLQKSLLSLSTLSSQMNSLNSVVNTFHFPTPLHSANSESNENSSGGATSSPTNSISEVRQSFANGLNTISAAAVRTTPVTKLDYGLMNNSAMAKRNTRWSALKRSSVNRKVNVSDSRQEKVQEMEDKYFADNYFTRAIPADLDDATIKTSVIKELPHINNHLIIIGKCLRLAAKIYNIFNLNIF